MPFSLNAVGDGVGDRVAVFGVVMHQRDAVGLGAGRLHVGEEVVIDLREVGRDRRGAEEPFEAALGEVGRNQLAVDEGNAVFLGDRAGGQRDAGLIGAGQRDHLLFGDQAQRLVLPGRGAALVIGEHHLDLGAAETGKAGALGEREIAELGMGVVDDVDRDFDRGLGMNAGAGGVAASAGKIAPILTTLSSADALARERERDRGGARQPEQCPEIHNDGSPKAPASADLSEERTRMLAMFALPLFLARQALHGGLRRASERGNRACRTG